MHMSSRWIRIKRISETELACAVVNHCKIYFSAVPLEMPWAVFHLSTGPMGFILNITLKLFAAFFLNFERPRPLKMIHNTLISFRIDYEIPLNTRCNNFKYIFLELKCSKLFPMLQKDNLLSRFPFQSIWEFNFFEWCFSYVHQAFPFHGCVSRL